MFLIGGIALFSPTIQNSLLYLNVVFFALCFCIFNIESSLCILLFIYSLHIESLLDKIYNMKNTIVTMKCSLLSGVVFSVWLFEILKNKHFRR